MNLYRNFGTLLECWETEGYPDSQYQSGAGLDRLDTVSRDSVPLSSVKSESEDSGFETVSPCHSHQCSGLTSESSDPVFGSTVDDVQPSSPSPSVCSSSSSCVSLGSVSQKTTCLKVENVLTEPPSWREPSHQMERGVTGPRCRCNTASFPPSSHPSSSKISNHRFAFPRRTHSQPSDPKKGELYRKILVYDQHCQPVDSQLEFADGDQYRLDKLSPGLLYLEQMCRMLENIAKLQQQNHSLQKEVEILKSQHAEIEILGHEDPDSGSSRIKERTGFRHRSASDTHAVSRHRRTQFARGERIADILVEEPGGKDPLPENEQKKLSKIQNLKFTSFRRQGTQQSDKESKSFQPKKKTKLPKIFRSRTMTTRF